MTDHSDDKTPTRMMATLNQQIAQAMSLWSQSRFGEAASALGTAAATARGDKLLSMTMLPSLLSRLGGLYIQLADYPKALKVLTEGENLVLSLFGPEAPDLLDFRNNLAVIHLNEGRYQEAREALLYVTAGRRKAFPLDRRELASALINLSRACAPLGLHDEAERSITEAYGILRPRAEPGDPLLTNVLHNLALTHDEGGRLTVASYFYEMAIENAAKKPAENALGYGAATNELGQLARKLMRQREVLDLAKQSVTVRGNALGQRHPDVGASLRTVGLLLSDLGSMPEALSYLRAAYQVFQATYGQQHPDTVFATLDMLSASRKAGADRDTELDLRDMINLARGLGAAENSLLLRLLIDLAALLTAKNEHDETRALLSDATRVFRTLQTPPSLDLQPYYRELAELLFAVGGAADAIDVLESVTRADDVLIGPATTTRDEVQKRRWLYRLTNGAADFVRAVAEHSLTGSEAAARDAFHLVLNRKGLANEAFLTRHDMGAIQAQPELTLLAKWIKDLELELAEVQAAGVVHGTEQRLASADALKQRIRRLSLELEAHIEPENQPPPHEVVDADRIAAALSGQTALIEFYAVRRSGDDAARQAAERDGFEAWLDPQPPERYMAFVIRSGDAAARLFDLGDGAEIDRLVNSYTVVLNQGQTSMVPMKQEADLLGGSEEELSRAVRKKVFDPIAGALDGCTTVIVAPDGTLSRLPFAALLEDGDSGRRLIERFTVGYVTSARDLLRSGGVANVASQPPLILGDPDYDLSRPGSAPPEVEYAPGLINLSFARLKGTADETWHVQRLVGGRRLIGRKANESALRGSRSPAILHIASHGYYVRPFANGIMVLGDIRRFPGFAAMFRAQILGYAENPLLRSGLALAGANASGRNEPVPEEMGDGLLNSLEIAHLDLRGTELAVLSACETALGDVLPGGGVPGLLQALRAAGVGSTIAALWQIPDESTVGLVDLFYQKLMGQAAVAPLTALCEAQRELFRQGKPAWHWGALVCYSGLAPIRYRPSAHPGAQE